MLLVNAVRRSAVPAFILTIATAGFSRAQSGGAPKPRRPAVCAQGVRVFTDPSQAPTPRDTVEIPAPDGPVRVSSPEEAEAAELALRGRAGSVGATGVIINDQVSDEGGAQRIHRSVVGIFAPADSAHAQAACKK
jgi:hypothetical protein